MAHSTIHIETDESQEDAVEHLSQIQDYINNTFDDLEVDHWKVPPERRLPSDVEEGEDEELTEEESED